MFDLSEKVMLMIDIFMRAKILEISKLVFLCSQSTFIYVEINC